MLTVAASVLRILQFTPHLSGAYIQILAYYVLQYCSTCFAEGRLR